MDFVLTLDRSASQAVSQEAFEPEELEEIFSTQELQDAGFDVELTESDSKTVLSISSRFSNEDELQRQLEVFADPSTLSAELSATKTFTTQTQNLSVDVDISRIKENYLDDPDVQAKVEAAGIDFAEFEEVVEQAFSSTTLNVVLVSDSETAQKEFTSESPKETVSLESSSLRTKYLLNMAGGVASLAAGLYILVGIRRRSRVTSQRSEEGM
jgi:hypothetical protein